MKVAVVVKLQNDEDLDVLNRLYAILKLYQPHLFKAKLEKLVILEDERKK